MLSCPNKIFGSRYQRQRPGGNAAAVEEVEAVAEFQGRLVKSRKLRGVEVGIDRCQSAGLPAQPRRLIEQRPAVDVGIAGLQSHGGQILAGRPQIGSAEQAKREPVRDGAGGAAGNTEAAVDGVAAARGMEREAVKQAGLDGNGYDPERVGCIIGSGIGGIETLETQHTNLVNRGPSRISPFFIPMMITPIGVGYIFRMMADTTKGPFANIWQWDSLSTSSIHNTEKIIDSVLDLIEKPR